MITELRITLLIINMYKKNSLHIQIIELKSIYSSEGYVLQNVFEISYNAFKLAPFIF